MRKMRQSMSPLQNVSDQMKPYKKTNQERGRRQLVTGHRPPNKTKKTIKCVSQITVFRSSTHLTQWSTIIPSNLS